MTISIKTAVITALLVAVCAAPFVLQAQFNGPPPPPPQGGELPPPPPGGPQSNGGGETVGGNQEVDPVRQALIDRIIAFILEKFGVDLATEDRPAGPPNEGGAPGGGSGPAGPGPNGDQDFVGGDTETLTGFSVPDSDYGGSYTLEDDDHGTEVEVTVSGDTRTIVANALPNHDTGSFPNSGNPNSISEQSNTYRYPATGEYTGEAVWAREPGVAINGVKFEPETAEMVTCDSGESYKIEALQDRYDLGFDVNNAHVQPDGTYHYHGVSDFLVDIFDHSDDLVHVGFAADGFMIYYDTTGDIEPSYALADSDRTGTGCEYRNSTIAIDGTDPDGTYVSDWEYTSGSGDLDACNGAFVDGEYAYFVTDDYPFIGRCLQGEL